MLDPFGDTHLPVQQLNFYNATKHRNIQIIFLIDHLVFGHDKKPINIYVKGMRMGTKVGMRIVQILN
jgi:hypothetical protein